MKADLVNLGIGQAGAIAILGYLVVFLGLVLLMLVVLAMASYFISKAKKPVVTEGPAPEPVKTAAPAAEPEKKAPTAPGTAGEFKLYNTDPRDAAMVMAIVADATGIPLNQLRFKSIKVPLLPFPWQHLPQPLLQQHPLPLQLRHLPQLPHLQP